jgi:hypothetical protein
VTLDESNNHCFVFDVEASWMPCEGDQHTTSPSQSILSQIEQGNVVQYIDIKLRHFTVNCRFAVVPSIWEQRRRADGLENLLRNAEAAMMDFTCSSSTHDMEPDGPMDFPCGSKHHLRLGFACSGIPGNCCKRAVNFGGFGARSWMAGDDSFILCFLSTAIETISES